MARIAKATKTETTTNPRYGEDPVSGFFPTGATLLDLGFGGRGYPLGRIVNIVGDFSAYKSGLGIEACINFKRTYPKGRMRYNDAERVFDLDYAEEIGLSREIVNLTRDKNGLPTITSVRQSMTDIREFLKDGDDKTPHLYVLDSLDALEQDLDTDDESKGGYSGARKAAEFNRLLQQRNSEIARKQCLFLVISQIRMNIGGPFEPKYRRAGGKALDFYSSIIVWLFKSETLYEEVNGVKIPYGIEVRADIKKNKIGKPFRTVRLVIVFGYGIDDEMSCLGWLQKDIKLETIEIDGKAYTLKGLKQTLKKARKANNVRMMDKIRKVLQDKTRSVWSEMDRAVDMKIKKYGIQKPLSEEDAETPMEPESPEAVESEE